jgi:hypothetical protein
MRDLFQETAFEENGFVRPFRIEGCAEEETNKKNKEDARPDMHRHDKNNRTPMHQARQRRE